MVVLFLVCLAAGILMLIRNKKDDCGFVLALIGGALVAISIIIYTSSYVELVRMEAFYEANRSAYEATVKTTKNAIYQISKQAALRIEWRICNSQPIGVIGWRNSGMQ